MEMGIPSVQDIRRRQRGWAQTGTLLHLGGFGRVAGRLYNDTFGMGFGSLRDAFSPGMLCLWRIFVGVLKGNEGSAIGEMMVQFATESIMNAWK